MRVVRVVAGMVLLLVALPVMLAGIVLWTALAHRGSDGAFGAPIEPLAADGYAVVVPDVDGLLRREMPFARGGGTVLRVTARTESGPAFVGLAPANAVAGYLAGVPHTQITDVKLTRGDLPVRAAAVGGDAAPATAPTAQRFWVANSTGAAIPDTVDWVPSTVRGQHFALVVMNPDGSAPVQVTLRASATVGWLPSTTWGLLVLGGALFFGGLVVLCWPVRPVQVVYVVEPSQLPEVGAGSSVPPPPPAEPVLVLPAPAPVVKRPRPPVTLELDWPPSRPGYAFRPETSGTTASGPRAVGTEGHSHRGNGV